MSEGLDNFSNVTTSLVAVVAVYIAWMGLGTWKAQIKWQTDHDLARRILTEIYRYRDAVAVARSPMIWAHEMRDEDETEYSGKLTDERHHAGKVRAHQRRLKEIGANGPQLYALLLEAEAVWGPELSVIWKDVMRLQNEYTTETYLYLDSLDPKNVNVDPKNFYEDTSIQITARSIVYTFAESEGKNDFSNRLKAAVSRLEDFLRPKLGRPTA